MISLDNLNILASLHKLPQNVGDLGKLIVAMDAIMYMNDFTYG